MNARRWYQLFSLMPCVLLALFVLAPVQVAHADGEYVPGEVVVVYEEEVPTAKTEQDIQKLGYEVEEQVTEPVAEKAAVAEVPKNTSVEEAVVELESLDGVALAQPNYIYHLVDPASEVDDQDTITNDTYQKRELLQNLKLASLHQAWDLAKTNKSVSVVVIDTGCYLNHEDLRNNVDWNHAWDFVSTKNAEGVSLTSAMGSNSSDVGDFNGHGTHVCGVVAAEANNSVGIAGVSYNANIIPMRVLDESGNGTTTSVIRALNKALALKHDGVNVRVVNMSLGGEGTDEALCRLIGTLADEGILCVCAAGNESSAGPEIPADAPDAISVMAVDKDNKHTYYTNYKEGSNINTGKTISAMGGGGSNNPDYVWSSYKGGESAYAGLIGTSQATPVVAGTAALVFAANPSLSAREVREILMSTADPINGNSNYSYKDGASSGSVNAYKAVAAAQNLAVDDVSIPQAEQLTYTGTEQAGVVSNDAYELQTIDLASREEAIELSDFSEVPSEQIRDGARATDVGVYQTVVQLKSGYMWEDNTSQDKSVVWEITPAPLTATYKDVVLLVGDTVPTDVEVTGFVNDETTQTAAGYLAPDLDLGGAADTDGKAILPEGEEEHEYAVQLTGGSADNYEFQTYAQGTVKVARKLRVEVPQAQDLDYNGKNQMGVPTGKDYELVGGEQKNAGTYTTTVRLKDSERQEWTDGTTADKTISWTIQKAPLEVRYNGGKVLLNTAVKDIPTGMTVTGFVNGETEKTLQGFAYPGLVQITLAGSSVLAEGDSLQSADLEASGVTGVVAIDNNVTSTVGVKYLMPAVVGIEVAGVSKGDPTANYKFKTGWSGELTVYGKATVPTVANKAYNGSDQKGVTGGAHCKVTGTTSAKNVGTYTATATVEKYYIWPNKTPNDTQEQRKLTWKITAANMSGASISGVGAATYTGKAIAPSPTVKLGSVTLKKDADYTVSYANNVNAGTATVTVKGKGNYTGSKSVMFKINPASITGIAGIGAATYSGKAITPGVTVKCGSATVPASGYSVSYANNVNAGTATVTVKGKGNYTGTKSATFKINPASISGISVAGRVAYTGSAQRPGVTVKCGSATVPASGYTVSYANNVNAGTATVTVKGKGNYAGTKSATFKIGAASISGISVVGSVTYTGAAQRPGITVKSGSFTVPASGYSVSYANNVNAGTATVTVTGKGNYAGTKSATFKIGALPITGVSVGGVHAYTGAAQRPGVTVQSGSSVVPASGYSVSYANNVNSGTATVTVTGKGNYVGSMSTTFQIVAPSVSYRVHVQTYGDQPLRSNGEEAGTTGQSKRLEAIWINLDGDFPVSGGIQYRTHVQTYGWQDWVSDGNKSGTSGQSKRLEAIQIQLTGEMANLYDVYYRTHAQTYGWLGWAKNGAQAGTAGYSKRLESIQIVLVPKGGQAPGQTDDCFRERQR